MHRLLTAFRTRVLVAVVGGLLAGANGLLAADPELGAMQPYGFQRGTEVVTRLSGARLGDAESLLLYRTGIDVKEVKPIDDNQVEVKLAIAADCPLGFHGVRVRTATGVSNLQTLSVGALSEVSEVEPNSEFAHPQPIELGSTVNGVVQNEDVDYFLVTARKGERISVELEGIRLGMPPNNGTFFDPYVAILDRERFELARSDDAPLLHQDCLCCIAAPEDGTYVIEVRESSYGGSDLCKYRLHVGRYPRPTAVFPAGGVPGESPQVRWIGDPLGDWTSSLTLPTDQSEYEAYAQDEQGIAPTPLRMRINQLTNVLEVEPNEAGESATPFTPPAALNGIIERPGDIDWYSFSAKKGETYDVRLYARQPLRSPLDSVLEIVRANGTGVAGNDDSVGPDSYVRFQAPEDDVYRVVIRDQLANGAPDFVYRVEVTSVEPSLTLSLPERIQYVPVTVSVPQGNRMAVMVNATRVNFGGPLQLSWEGLPPGIGVQPVTMAADAASVPMLFAASPDAARGGALADLVGRPEDPNLPVVGHLQQRTMLVRGQNNVDVWGHDAQRAAVAVTQAAPFSIEIVQPQVPIVRNGAMQLKVTARREEGFTGAIAIYLLYNPPGIGSSGSVSIPPEQTEAVIPLTANGSAAIGQWPLIVLGQSQVGNGTIVLASPLAQLEIADIFFDFTIEKSAAELGQVADVLVHVTKKRDFEGTATVALLGLPAKTSLVDAAPLEFQQDTTELVFKVQVEPDARPGKNQTLVCQATLTVNGEPILHTLGSGELRIDEPLPPKADAPPAAPQPAPEPAPAPEAPPEKRLTRLEQLRLEREQNMRGK